MTTPHDAEGAVVGALRSVGLEARRADSGDSVAGFEPDIMVTPPGGKAVSVEVQYTSLASVDGLPRKLRDADQRLRAAGDRPAVGILVADRVTSAAREQLHAAGWGWLDLRGHLHLAAPGIFVHADVPKPLTAGKQPSDPFTGRGGIEVAVALLLDPTAAAGVRPIAQRIGRAPSTVSETLARLRKANLVDAAGRPAVPELFWELASAWRPESADIAVLPAREDRALMDALRVGLEHAATAPGWALTDSRAAAAYQAPIGIRSDHPEDFYLPDKDTFRRALRLLGKASDSTNRAGTIRIAPVAEVCAHRVENYGHPTNQWPLAQPLFVALDLAQDPGRGRIILDEWTPPKRWKRVW